MCSSKPKISVIIPVYNAQKYLEKCLYSVLNQTLKDIEIICINDGSTDNSLSILNNIKEQSLNIKLHNIKNSGASVARNLGLEVAEADYISFVDSDDTIPETYFSTLYNEALSSGADIVMTGFNFIKNNSICPFTNYEEGMYSDFTEKCSNIINGAVWDKLFKASFLKQHNLKFVEGRMWEDNLFIIQALYYSNAMKIINHPRYNYRINPESVTNNLSILNKRVEDALFIYNVTMAFAKNSNMMPQELIAVDKFLRNKALPGYIK